MTLADIVHGPWAITPTMYREVQAVYSRHLAGEKTDLLSLEAAMGRPLASEPKGYDIVDGIAVLPIDGVIGKKMNLLTNISGGVSTDLTGREVERAMNDPEVKGIILAIDSPGGTVTGTPDLAALIASAKDSGKKPMCAWTDGCMCSAAYWIGSAAGRVFISSEATQVGSIGVVAQHTDISGAEAKQGIKTTEISAGKYKRIASEHGPLTEEGRASIQSGVDYTYSVFVDAVAQHRKCSSAEVLSTMADGRVFNGSQAVTAGLADGVSTLSACIDMLKNEAVQQSSIPYRRNNAIAAHKENHMTIEQLKTDHPDLVRAVTAEATAGHAAAITAAHSAGAAAERTRITGVRAMVLPGHGALIETLAFDGKTTPDEAARAVIAAEKGGQKQAAADILSESPPVVPAADAGDSGASTATRAQFNTMGQVARAAFIKSGGRVA